MTLEMATLESMQENITQEGLRIDVLSLAAGHRPLIGSISRCGVLIGYLLPYKHQFKNRFSVTGCNFPLRGQKSSLNEESFQSQ